jgi:hypothetical protein
MAINKSIRLIGNLRPGVTGYCILGSINSVFILHKYSGHTSYKHTTCVLQKQVP